MWRRARRRASTSAPAVQCRTVCTARRGWPHLPRGVHVHNDVAWHEPMNVPATNGNTGTPTTAVCRLSHWKGNNTPQHAGRRDVDEPVGHEGRDAQEDHVVDEVLPVLLNLHACMHALLLKRHTIAPRRRTLWAQAAQRSGSHCCTSCRPNTRDRTKHRNAPAAAHCVQSERPMLCGVAAPHRAHESKGQREAEERATEDGQE